MAAKEAEGLWGLKHCEYTSVFLNLIIPYEVGAFSNAIQCKMPFSV